MTRTKRELLVAVLNKIFDFLLVILTFVLLVNKFRADSIVQYASLDYFLVIITVFGFGSILLRSVSGER